MSTQTITTLQSITIDPAKLKAARGSMSLSEAARQVGISRMRLWDYENGLSKPNSDIVARLCILYARPIEDFTSF